jgi:2',3'-cyclic-nucleotide 2'-phosphodiesterase (5'-nucleotidase family)
VTPDETVYRRKPFGGSEILPANEAAQAEASRLLRDERCTAVIPLTHQPMAADRELARAQSPAFPVIVGGHEHEVFLEQVSGTWIVKAGADAVEAVVIDLTWEAEERAAGAPEHPVVTVRLEEVAKYPENAELRARVNLHMKRVHEVETATLLRIPPGQSLSSVGMRCRQTTMGTLVCSRVRDALDAEVCVFNSGGIRGAREYKGRVTYGDLKAEVPFDNEVVVAILPGSVLREAVCASRAHAPAESGGFLQVDDHTTVDPATNLVTMVAGVPFAEDRAYRVAIVRNLFDGLDHIEPLVRFARENPDKIPPALSGRDVKILLVDAFSLALWKELGGFDAVDANHDGVVTGDEIAVAVARLVAEPLSPLTADLVIHALDGDLDHTISRAEADAVNAPKKKA